MFQRGRGRGGGRGRHSDPSHASYAPSFNRGGGGSDHGAQREATSQSSRQWRTNDATIITGAPQTSFQSETGPSQRRPEGTGGYSGVVAPTPTREPRTNTPLEPVPAQASLSPTPPDAEALLICEMEEKLTLTPLTPALSKAIRFPARFQNSRGVGPSEGQPLLSGGCGQGSPSLQCKQLSLSVFRLFSVLLQ
ncbi:hypothetical protein COP1_006590 [Malus domestica]